MGGYDDEDGQKAMGLVGPLIPIDTTLFDFVRRSAKAINLQFDEKGNPKPLGE
jgi:hypothetical protein